MLLKAVNLNISLTNADLLLETKVLNENEVICLINTLVVLKDQSLMVWRAFGLTNTFAILKD